MSDSKMCCGLLWALLLVSPSARAQTEPPPDSQPAPDPEAPQQAAPQQATPQPAAPQPADDGLQVPATLAPLIPDSTSVETTNPGTTSDVGLPASRLPDQFGHRGQWAMMGSSNSLGISNQTFSNSSATFFNVGGAIGIDHFFVRNFSVGFDVEASYGDNKGYGATTLNETTTIEVSGGVRLGLNVPLSAAFSWYPRLTLSIGSTHSHTNPVSSFNGAPLGPPSSESSVGPATNLYAPLLVQLAPHLVLGFGPRLQHDFSVARGGPYDGSQRTLVSGQLVIGGWWGGAEPERAAAESAGLARDAKPITHVFGEERQVVLTMATDASVSYRSYSGSKASLTDVSLAPSFDYFINTDVSVGAGVAIGYASGTSVGPSGMTTQFSSKSVGIAPHLGGNLRLTEPLSIWLRGEIGYGTVDQSQSAAGGTNQHTRARWWVTVSAPLLLHPSSHFFVGAGPYVVHELSDQDQNGTQNEATVLGVSLVLGGWFAAADTPAK